MGFFDKLMDMKRFDFEKYKKKIEEINEGKK